MRGILCPILREVSYNMASFPKVLFARVRITSDLSPARFSDGEGNHRKVGQRAKPWNMISTVRRKRADAHV